ncbi:hypothetical protein [Streptomyces sp. NPDC003077]|uniref:hypothetical protein n=1 Tax=Streptomyces sp. NPDC003077 TaxID=3154443 RepID=UPI0033A838C4
MSTVSFEIRIICDRHEVDRIVAALADAFVTGPPRQYQARDGIRARLYVTAEPKPTAETTD